MVRKVYFEKDKKEFGDNSKKKKHGKFAPIVIRSVMVSKFTLHLPTF